jgi:hypothetical protein
LPAFDSDDKFIKITDLEVSLRGSLVLVYFELKHYAIRDKRSNCVSTNTFSATASQVKILELGGDRKASPYKSLLLKGPKTLPQSPSKKKEQASAVRAFHPGKLFTAAEKKKLNLSMTAVATGSNMAAESEKEGIYSKAEGKKRARDDDEDATATEGENSVTSNLSKKTRKR